MADPKADLPAPLTDTVAMAMSGDPVILRNLAATLGAFSVRILVAAAIFAVTLWAAKRLARGAERALARLNARHAGHPADDSLPAFAGVTLRCWTHPDVWMNTRFDLTKQVKETFESEGLSFPYPHQVAVDRNVRRLAVALTETGRAPEAEGTA